MKSATFRKANLAAGTLACLPEKPFISAPAKPCAGGGGGAAFPPAPGDWKMKLRMVPLSPWLWVCGEHGGGLRRGCLFCPLCRAGLGEVRELLDKYQFRFGTLGQRFLFFFFFNGSPMSRSCSNRNGNWFISIRKDFPRQALRLPQWRGAEHSPPGVHCPQSISIQGLLPSRAVSIIVNT